MSLFTGWYASQNAYNKIKSWLESGQSIVEAKTKIEENAGTLYLQQKALSKIISFYDFSQEIYLHFPT